MSFQFDLVTFVLDSHSVKKSRRCPVVENCLEYFQRGLLPEQPVISRMDVNRRISNVRWMISPATIDGDPVMPLLEHSF